MHTPGYQSGNGYVRLTSAPSYVAAPVLNGSNITNLTGVIKNQTSQQANANFNISGSGAVGGTLVADANGSNKGSVANALLFGTNRSGEGLGSNRSGSGNNQYGLDFYTSNQNRLTITGTGNVGIGTTAPSQKLDVNGSQNLTGTLTLNSGDQDKIYLTSQGAAGSKLGHGARWGLLSYAGPGTGSQGYHAWLLSGATAYQESMRLTATGLGIGTNAPSQQLELGGQAAPKLLLHSNGNNLTNGATLQFRENDLGYGWNLRHNSGASEGGSTDDRLVLESANGAAATPVMTWNQGSGNVGIGTTTPAYKLDVTGDAQISGSLALGLVTVFATATVAPGALQFIALSCPNGTRLLTGGGGYRQLAIGAVDISLRYSGPNPDSPTTTWMLYAQNTGTSNRDVYITCNCARIQ